MTGWITTLIRVSLKSAIFTRRWPKARKSKSFRCLWARLWIIWQITVLGQDLTTATEDELAKLRQARVGVVFQSFHLLPTMTALENIRLPLEIAGQTGAEARARNMLAAVGLAERAKHYPAQLSGGEQQRVALARALAPGPELLLADEPTGNLDGHTGDQVTDLMFELAEQFGATLILVTHSNALAEKCSRVVRLSDGRIAA